MQSPDSVPSDDALLTGCEFLERYLLPISRSSALSGRIHVQTKVRAIGRASLGKTDQIGSPLRGDDPFQLLLADDTGERNVSAEIVLDCSGTYPHHRWIGAGGVPCIGETTALCADDYRLPDILGGDRAKFAGRTTLVVGSGYSAATAIVSLATLAETAPQTRALWITRAGKDHPIAGVDNDALPERARLTELANRLALAEGSAVTWLPGRSIHRVEFHEARDCFQVAIRNNDDSLSAHSAEQGRAPSEITVDRMIANVGYRPDRTLAEELQFHECYATQGPIKLAAALLGETSSDCLSQASHGASALCNPEPNYFVLGSKSYGRDPRFLISVGLAQIDDVMELMVQRFADTLRPEATAAR